jgi:pre-mRNA-splicing helicase BRR2
MALEKSTIGLFLRDHPASREILQVEAEGTRHADLKELLPYGFAIHHAGMLRIDRTLVEDLFADKHIQVLVSTATLAWGVNLPAHTVIIKGTQIYRPEKGRWAEISPQDVMQMFGRAGRPQFDTHGEGILITSHSELPYYLSLLNEQLPIESQLLSLRLLDALNAEIVLGTVRNREEAIDWLAYTYLYVRMLRQPAQYGITMEELERDETLVQYRLDLIHSAALRLDQHRMIVYDRRSGQFRATELGRIASHYYVTASSMATYQLHLKSTMSEMELLRVFALSEEFKFIPVREEEKLELAKLAERVPIPIKESLEEPTAKINVLLQAYISQLKLEGFALMADMIYVTQSAARLFRAIFEMALSQGWAGLSHRALHMSLMVEKRMWTSMSPLRQFKTLGGTSASLLPEATLRSLEKKDIPFERLYDLKEHELGELVRQPKMGKVLHRMLRQFPKLDVQATMQPITRSMLHVEVTLTTDFQMDLEVHGSGEPFWILVEDCNADRILYHDYIVLKTKYAKEPYRLDFTVPLFDPLHPTYFMTVLSDRWLSCEMSFPMSFKYLLLPEKCPPPTNLLDLQPLNLTSLQRATDEAFLASRLEGDDRDHLLFNGFQTQVFSALYTTDESVLVCAAAPDNELIVCAELALLSLWNRRPSARAVCIEPTWEMAQRRAHEWRGRLSLLESLDKEEIPPRSIPTRSGKTVVLFHDIGDDDAGVSEDLRSFENASLVVSTARKWDQLSRRWQTKQAFHLRHVDLLIIDGIHLLGSDDATSLDGGSDIGPALEVIVSRMRRIAIDTKRALRFVGLGAPLANAKDVADWIGCSTLNTFNFAPSARSVPLTIEIPEGVAWSSGRLASSDTHAIGLNKQAFHTVHQHLMRHDDLLATRKSSPKHASVTSLPSAMIFVPTNEDVSKVASQFLFYLLQEAAESGEEPDTDENQMHHALDETSRKEKEEVWSMLRCRKEDLQPYLGLMQQRHVIVQQLITLGIGCYHEGLSKDERSIMEQLYRIGVLPLLICSRESCWSLLSSSLSPRHASADGFEKGLGASMVLLLGTQYYLARECRQVEYSLFDVWRMLSFACRSAISDGGQARAFVLCTANRRDYYRKMTGEAMTVESHLDAPFGVTTNMASPLQDHFNAEVAFRTLESKQEAVDYLTWTFLYRRISKNPNYYRLQGTSHRHMSEHLSELVEATFDELTTKDAECVEFRKDEENSMVDHGDETEPDMKLVRTPLGHIAAHGYIHATTVQLFRVSLSNKTKLKGLLEMISGAMEFDGLPIRHHERSSLERLHQRMPVKLSTPNFRDPHVKTHLLLQSHFSRARLSVDLEMDLRRILRCILPLVHAMVDISGQEGYLAPALAAMEFSQMIVQAMWDRDSDLKQLPHMTSERIERCTQAGVNSVVDLMELPDDRQRRTLLNMPDRMLADVARACNRYPAIDLEFAVLNAANTSAGAGHASQKDMKSSMRMQEDSPSTTISVGEEVTVAVRLEREGDEEESDGEQDVSMTPVIASCFPERKLEGWWLMIGDSVSNEVFALKRVHSLSRTSEVSLKFYVPESKGQRQLHLYFICDSYIGCDQEYPFTLNLI